MRRKVVFVWPTWVELQFIFRPRHAGKSQVSEGYLRCPSDGVSRASCGHHEPRSGPVPVRIAFRPAGEHCESTKTNEKRRHNI